MVAISLVPNSVTTIFGLSLIHHELSHTTVIERLRKHHGLYRNLCQNTHEVKIIMVTYLFLSIIVDIVVKVIADSKRITFQAIYSANKCTYHYVLLATTVSRIIHEFDSENKSNLTWKHVSIES